VIDFPQAWGSENIEQYVSQYGTKLSDTRTFVMIDEFTHTNYNKMRLHFKELGNKWVLVLSDGASIITTLLVFK
jgi:hypothetical protein